FFQAEDGIRDGHVTGVQTCALPISRSPQQLDVDTGLLGGAGHARRLLDRILERSFSHYERAASISMTMVFRSVICSSAKCPPTRSEERRVGKECRSRRAANGSKDNR